jgi:hypothetical protein
MKISELKQPYRAIAEADKVKYSIKSMKYTPSVDSFLWSDTKAGHQFYKSLYFNCEPPITDKICKDYADVFAKLETQPEWIPVKGEMVEVSTGGEIWAEREFVHDLGEEFSSRYITLYTKTAENGKKISVYWKHIRRSAPVTELTLSEVKQLLNIKEELQIDLTK